MKIRERFSEATLIGMACFLISFVFLFVGATWYTGSWQSGLLWGFLLSAGFGICAAGYSKFAPLPEKDKVELVKNILALIGFFGTLYWLAAPSRPYCADM